MSLASVGDSAEGQADPDETLRFLLSEDYPSHMGVSIALCTYNGARYLPDLFESLLGQTRPPNKLIIADDRSSDETPRLVSQFADQAKFPVIAIPNQKHLGINRNFDS